MYEQSMYMHADATLNIGQEKGEETAKRSEEDEM